MAMEVYKLKRILFLNNPATKFFEFAFNVG